MKNLCFILLIAASAYGGSPATARLYKDHFACSREVWLRDTYEYADKRDQTSMISYLAMRRCFRTLDAIVYLLALKNDAAQILVGGRTMWVDSDAIEMTN
ncbi:MAG: hypothetical protein LBI57_02165 [Helicobacteraceae bacterium]|jgi:hypothetical protein|nr:hypothetical protein [Helicobacteraceae bacterium]